MMEANCAKYLVFWMCIVLAASSKAITNSMEESSPETCGQRATWSVYMEFLAEAIEKAKNTSVTCLDIVEMCGQKQALITYLGVANDMVNKARINLPTCTCNKTVQVPRDCSDLFHMGHNISGVYTISPINRLTESKSVDVYCDMETEGGGWTVIQRRGDFQNPADYFYKGWKSYKEGFGDVEKEFWLGNDNIFALTNQGLYSVRFDLVDVDENTNHAEYESFWIDGESSKYILHISDYSGGAGDAMMTHNNQKFTTKDLDNDSWNDGSCAQRAKGAWWFNACYDAHLNGENLKGTQSEAGNGKIWKQWEGNKESLLSTEIKIRPKNFRI